MCSTILRSLRSLQPCAPSLQPYVAGAARDYQRTVLRAQPRRRTHARLRGAATAAQLSHPAGQAAPAPSRVPTCGLAAHSITTYWHHCIHAHAHMHMHTCTCACACATQRPTRLVADAHRPLRRVPYVDAGSLCGPLAAGDGEHDPATAPWPTLRPCCPSG